MTAQEFVTRVFAEAGVLPAPKVLQYGVQLSPYLHVGIDQVASPDTGEVALLPQLVQLDAVARKNFAAPLLTSAGFRTVQHELDLAARGYKTAGFVSPHSVGAALDKTGAPRAGKTASEINALVQLAYKQAAQALGLPAPRLGHQLYSERFTHVDLVFLLFAPYTALPHPSDWPDLEPAHRQAFAAWRPGVEW